MNAKTYLFLPEKKIIKQGFYLEDENKTVVYEAKMTKQGIIGKSDYKFINHITNTEETHKIGHTITIEENNNFDDMLEIRERTKSYFKIDGVNIWNYITNMGYTINPNKTNGKLGIMYELRKKDKLVATIEMSNLNKSVVIMNRFVYQVKVAEEDIDIAFLVAFAISKTNHVFFD